MREPAARRPTPRSGLAEAPTGGEGAPPEPSEPAPDLAAAPGPAPPEPSPPGPAANASPALGIGLKVASALAFTLMSALLKLAGRDSGVAYPVGELVFFRSAFAVVPVLLWLGWQGRLRVAVDTRRPLAHLRRGLVGSAGMFCGFGAVLALPLPDATALGYAAPLLTVVLAALVLGERVRAYRWAAVGVGFLGVLVMLVPYLGASSLARGLDAGTARGVAFALAGAACSAVATIETRRLTASEKTGTIVFFFSMTTTAFGALTYLWGLADPEHAWRAPAGLDPVLLVSAGVIGGLAQIFLTECYRYADASVIAPFDYASMIFAVALGWFLFGEAPAGLVLAGALIVAAAGVFIILRERALGIERKRQRRAQSPRVL